MSDDPTRWLDDPDTEGFLRDALEAGRQEAPSDMQLAALAERLGPLLGGGGPGGGPPVDPSAPLKLTTAAKGAAGLVAAALAIAGGVALWGPADPPAPAPTPERAAIEPPAPPAGPAIPEGLDPPPEEAPAEEAVARVPPRYEVDPAAELALVEAGQRALRDAPTEALARAEEHRRRFGPSATLAQERELIAIEALWRTEQRARARRRADAFHRRWPTSAHGRRVDVIVGG